MTDIQEVGQTGEERSEELLHEISVVLRNDSQTAGWAHLKKCERDCADANRALAGHSNNTQL
jgi:hypothetical protein